MTLTVFTNARRALLAAATLLFAASCASAPALRLDADTAAAVAHSGAETSAARRIRADVVWLADDAREGREAGTAGYDAAADYVAARFAALGLKPAGEKGGWFQQVTLRRSMRNLDLSRLVFAREGAAPAELVNLEDYLITTSAVTLAEVSAPVVFAGYGVTDPESGHDDYAGLDVKGKIVAVFSGAPADMDSEKRAHYTGQGAKARNAAARGAAAIISLPTIASEKRFNWSMAQRFARNASMTWLHPDGTPNEATPSMKVTATLSVDGARKLFEGAALSFDALRDKEAAGETLAGFDLPIIVSMQGGADYEDVKSPNVAGMIEGADPALKHEVVVLTAHLDGVGVEPPRPGQPEGVEVIRNGALDNAMGVATMIEAARAFVESGVRPARTIVFLAVTAEEKGLLGAGYYARHPTVPKEAIVANVNLDMPLVLFDFVDVIAFGAERSTLGELVGAAAGSMGIALSPDPVPEQNLFTRSDHYRFVEQGVPSVFLVVGFGNGGDKAFADFLATHYHRAGDDISLPIDYDAAARFAELNYRIARAIAAAPERPRWKEGDFFGEMFAK